MENELFEKTKVSKAYMTLALPVVLGMVVSLIYNMVDTYFIAGTGNTDLVAGVALGTPIFTLMIALGDIFGLGGSSFISRLFGEKKFEDAKRISVFSFYGAIVCGVVVTVVLMLLRSPILGLLGASEATWEYASQYYTCIALGAPFIIVALTPSNQLRTEGFATASMIGSVLGAVVNIILDPVFIYGFRWGMMGAAVATVLGQILTAAMAVRYLCHMKAVDLKKACGWTGRLRSASFRWVFAAFWRRSRWWRRWQPSTICSVNMVHWTLYSGRRNMHRSLWQSWVL